MQDIYVHCEEFHKHSFGQKEHVYAAFILHVMHNVTKDD